MSAEYTYDVAVVYNPDTDLIAANVAGYFTDVLGGGAQPIYDMNASPIVSVMSNDNGITRRFRADIPYGYMVFGAIELPVFSMEAIAAGVAAAGLVAVAQQAASDAAEAAAAAQTAAQQVADLIANGGGSGLDIQSLETRVGGAPGATQGLIPRLAAVRVKSSNGIWPPKSNLGFAVDVALGPAPQPADFDTDTDIWLEVAL